MVIASSVPARFGRHTEGGLKVCWFHRCPQSLTEDAVMVEKGRVTSPRRFHRCPQSLTEDAVMVENGRLTSPRSRILRFQETCPEVSNYTERTGPLSDRYVPSVPSDTMCRFLYGRDAIWNEARASVAAEQKPRGMDDSGGPLPGMSARGSTPFCMCNTRAAVAYLPTGQTYVCTASKQLKMDIKMYP
ncbi:hypothetical protein GW17_00031820 [Ensete ventricosum]|nr:hypothetical protein GW17_00031820 [Ensete ventricosum]